MLSLACVLLALLGAGVVVADLLAARQRAAAAADLAALAAAALLPVGQASACAEADRVAAANVAVLRSCRVEGDDVRVRVATRPRTAAADRLAAAVLPDGIVLEAHAGLRPERPSGEPPSPDRT